jgi:predicted phosphodiesterase
MIALVSDIHGNIEALDAVCADIAERGCEAVLCLGDVVGYGPDPKACLDRAMGFDVTIMGNHDHAVFIEPAGFNTPAERSIFWTRKVLESEPDEALRRRRWEFLARMGTSYTQDGILYVHGSPRHPMHEYLFPDEGEMSPEKLMQVFDLVKSVCFLGHTHLPGVFTAGYEFLTPAQVGQKRSMGEGKMVINIGSVGQPRDLDPRACYVTLDGNEVQWHRVPYDCKTTMEKILAIGELDDFLANRLAEGR